MPRLLRFLDRSLLRIATTVGSVGGVACATTPPQPLLVQVCPPATEERAPAPPSTPARPVETSTSGVARVVRGNLVLENVPSNSPELEEKVRAYQNARRARLVAADPSGGILIRTRFGTSDQLHHVTAPGMARRQMTFFKEPISEVQVSRNTKQPNIVVSFDTGGNERFQIYRVEADGRGTLLTDGKSSNRSLALSNDGRRVAYMSTERNGKDFDVWIADVTTGARSLVFQSPEGWWSPLDWSPDDSKIVLLHPTSVTKSSLHVLEVGKGIVQTLEARPGEREIAFEAAAFSADGKGLFFTSDQTRDTKALFYRDLDKQTDTMVADAGNWDISGLFLDPSRRRIGVNINAGGFTELRVYDARTRKRLAVPALPKGVIIESALRDDGTLLYTLETPRMPADVFSVRVGGGPKPDRWTESEPAGMALSKISEAELVEFPSFDTGPTNTPRQIPAFVIGPATRSTKGAPVVVLIHGGPEAQSRPMFSAQTAMLVAEYGYMVVQPNVRGSTGYGRTYTQLDNGRLREDSVKDIGALLDYLKTRPDVDASRIAILGGSYGGYMVLASGIHFADRIKALVDVVGISHFVTFLESTEPYRRDLRRVEYGDERDESMRAFLHEVSPLTRAHEIADPLFVIQGKNDPRVPVGEAEQIVRKVRERQDVWYMLAQDEGHGFRKKDNQDAMMAAIANFLTTQFGQE